MLVKGDKAKKEEELAFVGSCQGVEGSPTAYVKKEVGTDHVGTGKRVT